MGMDCCFIVVEKGIKRRAPVPLMDWTRGVARGMPSSISSAGICIGNLWTPLCAGKTEFGRFSSALGERKCTTVGAMANEGDPERPGGADWSERPPEWTALVERVARLELEFAALQREIIAKGVDVDR